MWKETTCDKVDLRVQHSNSVVLFRAQGQGLNETKPRSGRTFLVVTTRSPQKEG